MAESKASATTDSTATTASTATAETTETTEFKSELISVKVKGITNPIRTMTQNPDDKAKAARGMVCMMMLTPAVVKSIATGLTYVFPECGAVWVHKNDVNLCGGKGAAPYKKVTVATE